MNGLQNGKTDLASRGHKNEIKDSRSERTRGKKKQDVLTEINVRHHFACAVCKVYCICDFVMILCTVRIDGFVL